MLELNAQTIAFFIFAILTLGGALGVVTSRNLIHGALYLIVSLFGGAGFFVLLSAPFIAVVQVLVYIGAIAILIIFAVMLTRSMTTMRELFNRQWWMSALVGALLFVLLTIAVIMPVWGANGSKGDQPVSDEVATTAGFGRGAGRWQPVCAAVRSRVAAADGRDDRRDCDRAGYRRLGQ